MIRTNSIFEQYRAAVPFDKITRLTLGLCFFCLLLTVVALMAATAHAEDAMPPQPEPIASEAPELNPVHDLIRRQLSAIKARNAELAWSLTTGHIHEKFETGKEYLNHLRLQLRPIYNSGAVKFLDQSDTESGYIQRVEIDEHDGEPVTVIYRVEKQESGELLIDSFAILDDFDAEPI